MHNNTTVILRVKPEESLAGLYLVAGDSSFRYASLRMTGVLYCFIVELLFIFFQQQPGTCLLVEDIY